MQVVPHIIDEIRRRIDEHYKAADIDLLVLEIGGTVGDIESLPFLEAVRQLKYPYEDEDIQVGLMHVSLLPYLHKSGELKTKATQHSIAELRSHGLQPDFLACRSEFPMGEGHLRKLAAYSALPASRVLRVPDVEHIYQLPLELDAQGVTQEIQKFFGLEVREPDCSNWQQIVAKIEKARESEPLKIALIGKYSNPHELGDAYKSLVEAIRDCATLQERLAHVEFISAETFETRTDEYIKQVLSRFDGMVIPGGFGRRGIEGMVAAAKVARENAIPALGICLGMQVMAIEAMRNLKGFDEATSTEFVPDTKHPVISLVVEWEDPIKGRQKRSGTTDLGGTLRLGAQKVCLDKGSRVGGYYRKSEVWERHRHRYEVHPDYVGHLGEAGFYCVATTTTETDTLPEVFERRDGDAFYVGCQYHPEFTCNPKSGQPLIGAFVRAAMGVVSKQQSEHQTAQTQASVKVA